MNQHNFRVTDYNKPFILQRADPYMYKHTDGTYYFTASVPEYDRIVLRGAKTIKGLKQAEEHVLWRKHEEGEQSIHIWAPELHYLYGEWVYRLCCRRRCGHMENSSLCFTLQRTESFGR